MPSTAIALLPVLVVLGQERMRHGASNVAGYIILQTNRVLLALTGEVPAAPARRMEPLGPAYDPVAEQHSQALDLNKDGIGYYQHRDWANAVGRFREALKKWPENQDIRTNLANAEKAWNDEQNKQAVKGLGNALKEQEKTENVTNLNNALKEQENRESVASLNNALKEQEKRGAPGNSRQDLAKKQEARIAGLLQKMKVDQQAIRALGLYDPRDPEKRARDFEEWARLTKEAQIEFEKEYMEDILVAVEAVVTEAAVHGAGAALKPIKSLNPATVSTQIAWLRSKGVTDPYLFDAMRAIARTPGKPELAEKILGRLQIAAKVVEAGITPDLRAGSEENVASRGLEQMDGLAAVLGVVDSKYKILAADFRFTASSFYNSETRWVSQSQVNSLTKLTESQLKLLVKYNERIRDHGDQLKKARQELARLSEGQ